MLAVRERGTQVPLATGTGTGTQRKFRWPPVPAPAPAMPARWLLFRVPCTQETYARARAHARVCVCACVHVHACVCMCVCARARVCVCVCVSMCHHASTTNRYAYEFSAREAAHGVAMYVPVCASPCQRARAGVPVTMATSSTVPWRASVPVPVHGAPSPCLLSATATMHTRTRTKRSALPRQAAG